jgi:hypothetical protein
MKTKVTGDWPSIVQRTVETLDYGVVQIIVHNSRVVQIECTQKIRFDSETNKNSLLAGKEVLP